VSSGRRSAAARVAPSGGGGGAGLCPISVCWMRRSAPPRVISKLVAVANPLILLAGLNNSIITQVGDGGNL